MIEIDRTDEEREELVKGWIKEYWLIVVGVAGLAIALVYGLNYYRQSKINALSQTAAKVTQVTNDLIENRIDVATANVINLQDTQADTSFSTVATLTLAKKLFEQEKYTEAAKQYEWIVINASDASIRDVSRLRKARAEANAKQYENAVKSLGGLEYHDFIVEATLLKGDIYMDNNQFLEAQKAYDSIPKEHNLSPELIQQRKDLLSIKQHKAQ